MPVSTGDKKGVYYVLYDDRYVRLGDNGHDYDDLEVGR
jgi:hypothetical protein